MTTRIEDSKLGTLIKIDEVTALTGISKSSLRSWRRDAYRHLAKFDEYTHPSSNAVWYRLADIEAWLLEHGKEVTGSSMFIRSEAPNAVRAPVDESMTPDKHAALTELRKITTANHVVTYLPMVNKMVGRGEVHARLMDLQIKFYSLFKGAPDTELTFIGNAGVAGEHFEQYYYGTTQAIRRIYADARKWDVTDAEILALPVGDVPPLKETK